MVQPQQGSRFHFHQQIDRALDFAGYLGNKLGDHGDGVLLAQLAWLVNQGCIPECWATGSIFAARQNARRNRLGYVRRCVAEAAGGDEHLKELIEQVPGKLIRAAWQRYKAREAIVSPLVASTVNPANSMPIFRSHEKERPSE